MFESPIRRQFRRHIAASDTHFGVTALRLNGTRPLHHPARLGSVAVTWTHRRAEPSAADFPALSSWILGWAKRNGDKGCWML
jgi:hypothetical protein